jgi:hypothetical protein
MAVVGLAVLAPAQAQEPASAPAPQLAQEDYRQDMGITGPLVWNLGGSLGIPLGDTSDRLNIGGGLQAGFTYNPVPFFGAQFEYGVNWDGLKTSSPAANLGVFGNATMHYFNVNAVVRPTKGRFGIYFAGGGGLYYRTVSVNQVNGTAAAAYCDPFLFYCSAVPVSTASLIGSRTSWDWGVDGGVGFTLGLTQLTRVYVEARYHYIWGPSFTGPDGQTHAANGQYLPITLGLQF